MIQSLLIANRGEIACRIIRTARAMGVRTVAIYSDADACALHVRMADTAVHIGPPPAGESYLDGAKIIAAAKQAGVKAIHPGYGFLSENADFAQAVMDAGLIWVGPHPASIRAMGLKDAAKRLMAQAGVPTTPGYLGEDQSPERLAREAAAIGYPVLIKAVAGGGGKGMRRVGSAADFADALASCRREAMAAFGDDRVLLEKWIANPRHIEVQIFGDAHGNVVHLFERDCSLQRRHQKVIEEAPAPGMDEGARAAICAAAVRAARAVDYVGAGTVEFIADASEGLHPDRIWFMEMNTRLQVEHPVTEAITGVDLVEWQLRVASGEPLPRQQEQLSIGGWAMEVRLYAEDPGRSFLPSTGKLAILDLPRNLRVDTGVEEGGIVSPFYDPMIAKLIAYGASREEVVDRLTAGVGSLCVWPVRSNAGFLYRALGHEAFRAGHVTTAFIDTHLDALLPPSEPSEAGWKRAALNLGSPSDEAPDGRGGSPWVGLDGFRLNGGRRSLVTMESGGKIRTVDRWLGEEVSRGGRVVDGVFVIVEDGQTHGVRLARFDGSGAGGVSDGAILSPMPGRVIAVAAVAGDRVTKGQKLVTLEAMKMEHVLIAPFDGQVTELHTKEGAQVSEGMLLVRIGKAE